MEAPLVTVLIPAYNSNPGFLAEAIESAASQSYQNLEILLVDDGSESALGVDLGVPGLRYHRMEHRGMPWGHRRGVEMAEGKYIAILEHDDVLTPGSIESRVEVLERTGVGLVYGDVEHIDSEGMIKGIFRCGKFESWDELVEATFSSLLVPYKHPGLMFSRQAAIDSGNYNTDFKWGFDIDMVLATSREHGFAHIPQVVVQYRIHESNASKGIIRLKNIRSMYGVIDKYFLDPKKRRKLKTIKTITEISKVLFDTLTKGSRPQWSYDLFSFSTAPPNTS